MNDATEPGFVTIHPCVDPAPVASSLDDVPGVDRGSELVATLDANEIIATLDVDGDVCLFTNRSIHLAVDVVGFVT